MTHIGRIKVIKEADDILDTMNYICICPHCGREVRYGDMLMYCGEYGCHECADDLHDSIEYDRQNHYDRYVRKVNNDEYEPYKYVGE